MAKLVNGISVIVPTYTGADSIDACLNSLLNQTGLPKGFKYEVVVVIDGVNAALSKAVRGTAEEFSLKKVPLVVCQHSHNKGRFEARRSGALKAHYDDLFFVDDRVTVPQSLLSEIIRAEERIIMPNVIESEYPNFMSRFLYLIRRKVYGKNRWGTSFSPYYIDNSNFEKSPKGTGSLCLPKDLFLESCSRLADTTVGSTKNISDDTKLLRYMIESGARIYRPSSIIVNYQPRQKLGQELYHVYQRGPKFVDYYFRRGSRFQPYLLVSLALLFLGVLGVLAWRWEFLEVILALSILGIVALAIILKERLSDLWVVCVALPVAIILFGLGILKGLGSKIYSRIA